MEIKKGKVKSVKNLDQDRELFRQIAEDQYVAMEKLFDKYYDALCRFGLSFEPNIGIVEEKISDVFIHLWNKRKELQKIEKPKSYLYVIAKNSLRKDIKSKNFHRSYEQLYGKQVPSFPSKEEEMIDEEQKEITTKLIKSILQSIPPKSRRIFELSRIDGLKYREISEIVNLSPRTVENHIALAMKHINKELRELHHFNNNHPH